MSTVISDRVIASDVRRPVHLPLPPQTLYLLYKCQTEPKSSVAEAGPGLTFAMFEVVGNHYLSLLGGSLASRLWSTILANSAVPAIEQAEGL
jgi:hypothetical protein